MTVHDNDGTGTRLMTDGGTEPKTVTRTATPTGVVTREVDGEEQDMIRVPISSTRADREGDRFTKEALEGMADQIRSENPMVFDNHGLAGSWMEAIPYDSRETIGAQMDAELESAEDGEWDLYALVNPDGTHPEGERMLRQVRDEGQPIKFSVGFRVLDYDAIEDDAGNEIGREFTRSDLMETSRVGIPANPDASVTQSMTAKGGDALPGVQNHPMFQMMRAMGQGGTERDAPGQAVTKDGVDSETVQEGTPVQVDGQEERDAVADGGESKEGGSCDVDADCPDGKVCVDGECVDEDEAEASADPAPEGKAFADVGMAEFDEFVAAHQEGASADEVGAALDEVGEWVGQLSRDETVALVAEACGESEDTVNEQFGEWLDDGDGDDTEEDAAAPEVVQELREENDELREEIADVRDSVNSGRGDAKSGDTTVEADAPEPEETDDTDDDSTESKTAMDVARGS
jgi:hypothetical protein